MNNVDYTLYRSSTGEIIQQGWGIPPSGPDVGWIFGQHDGSVHYVAADGTLADLPPRPDVPWLRFDRDSGEWVDDRSAAQLAADLLARRQGTALDKSELLIRLALAGILSPAEAEAAAGGAIPESMDAMMQALPPEARMAARIKWAADGLIGRTHPVIVAAAFAMGIPDEQLDAIFGVPV